MENVIVPSSLYQAHVACGQVTESETGWFPQQVGVKQTNSLSPTLSSVYNLALQIL